MTFGVNDAAAHGLELDHKIGLVLPEGLALGGLEDLEDTEFDQEPEKGQEEKRKNKEKSCFGELRFGQLILRA